MPAASTPAPGAPPGRRALAIAVVSVMLAAGACGPLAPGRGPETTFTQGGYTVICQWTGSAINAGGAPSIGPEAESFCRSRAREAVGTLLTTNPGAQVQTVTISSNGSAEVCYGDPTKPTCAQVLPRFPNP